jgi:hypothetical protein
MVKKSLRTEDECQKLREDAKRIVKKLATRLGKKVVEEEQGFLKFEDCDLGNSRDQ